MHQHAPILLLIFIANVILVRKLLPYQETIARGVEITLVGALLSGYWFGPKAGLLLGGAFIASSFAASAYIGPELLVALPAGMLLGLFGAAAAKTGISIGTAGVMGILLYCAVIDIILIKAFGEDDYLGMAVSDLGLIATNWAVIRLLF
ncbi:hypothetical protein JXA12_03960 [Candidatus Woesearchaeota archaeon]|nr:hypothetical protein [Candidatus Woesearchaeota archaeon]